MSLESVLRALFDGYETAREHEATLPLVDFDPLVKPDQLEVLSAALSTAVPTWEGITAVAGLAERSSGPLTHLLAHRRKLPYSLVNWYPEGSQGHITVGPALSFTGEKGNTFLNGLTPNDNIVFVDDCIRKGSNARNVLRAATNAGVKIACAVFVASFEGTVGVDALKDEFGIPVIALCSVDARGSKTVVGDILPTPTYDPAPLPKAAEIKSWGAQKMLPKFQQSLDAFVGNKIYRAKGSDYPYCNFTLTDMTPLLQPELVETMAECMIYLGDFTKGDVIVSEADRGGGPLAIAIARRTGLPFSLANWEAPVKRTVGVAASAQVGYSGSGSLYLNGIRKGMRCIIVDDMLSSGGTAEGLFKAIEAAGGVIVEGHFASEKVNTGGRKRLAKTWPDLPLFSITYFIAAKTETTAAPPGELANETPLQKKLPPPLKNPIVRKLAENIHGIVAAGMILFYCMGV